MAVQQEISCDGKAVESANKVGVTWVSHTVYSTGRQNNSSEKSEVNDGKIKER